jgi:hypothetical protein
MQQAVKSTLASLEDPPGRRPRHHLAEASEWFLSLSQRDRDEVGRVAEIAARHAVFNMLCVLDGVQVIEDTPENGQFVLTFHKGGEVSQISPSGAELLHELFNGVRGEVLQLVHMGRLPTEQADEDVIARYQQRLEAISRPVTDVEADLLVECFGPDDCYGLAWKLLHLIETAPGGSPVRVEPHEGANPWLRYLWNRTQRAKEVGRTAAALRIEPHVGAPPIRFGMSRSEVEMAVGEPPVRRRRNQFSTSEFDHYRRAGFFVYYDAADTCVAIEFTGASAVEYDGMSLFAQSADEHGLSASTPDVADPTDSDPIGWGWRCMHLTSACGVCHQRKLPLRPSPSWHSRGATGRSSSAPQLRFPAKPSAMPARMIAPPMAAWAGGASAKKSQTRSEAPTGSPRIASETRCVGVVRTARFSRVWPMTEEIRADAAIAAHDIAGRPV